MLKALRTNTKWIMITVAVCFVGMMIFAWGMDITGIRSGSQASVGKINGDDIPYTMYDNVVKMQRQQRAGDEHLTVYQERSIREEAWNNLVTQMVVNQDIERRKISYTDQELVNFMKTNPPQFVFSQQFAPLFFENDQFSMAKYQAFISAENLNNPQTAQILQYLEADAASKLPSMKFQEQLTNSVIVTDAMARERWLNENDKRKAEWFFINTTSVGNEAGTPSDSELSEYYNNHKEDFRRDERRVLSAVFIPLEPTASDSSSVLDLAADIIKRARDGASFETLANDYTEDPGNIDQTGNQRGGDLGWFARNRMVDEFADAAFAMKPGEISDPVLSRFGCHIIKVDSLKYKEDNKDEVEQVKARHVLLKIEPSSLTRDAVEQRINNFQEAIKGGAEFIMQAQLEELELRKTPPFDQEASAVPSIPGSSALLVNRAFDAKKGETLPTYYVDNGYFIIHVDQIIKAGFAPLEEVRSEVQSAVMDEKKTAFAKQVAERVLNRMNNEGKALKDAIEADDFDKIQHREMEIYKSYYVPGLGTMNEFIARIYELDAPGTNTGVVASENGAGIGVFVEDIPVDEAKFEEEKNSTRQRLESELKNQVIQEYVTNLVENADIVDNRHNFVGY